MSAADDQADSLRAMEAVMGLKIIVNPNMPKNTLAMFTEERIAEIYNSLEEGDIKRTFDMARKSSNDNPTVPFTPVKFPSYPYTIGSRPPPPSLPPLPCAKHDSPRTLLEL